jgi:hypothetical protein
VNDLDNPLIERVLEMAMAVQQIAAPTFAERERAAFVQQRFAVEGLEADIVYPAGNVFARLPGSGQAARWWLGALIRSSSRQI